MVIPKPKYIEYIGEETFEIGYLNFNDDSYLFLFESHQAKKT